VALLGVTACGSSGGKPAPRDATFDYDRSVPLEFVDHGRVNRDYPVQVRDVSFTGPAGVTISGFLSRPPGKGPFPAVVYLHGSGGDRSQLLVPAVWMAGRGAVTLTIDAPPVPPSEGTTAEADLRRQREATVRAVVTARRAVDALQALPQVDDSRIGLVGWSEGARTERSWRESTTVYPPSRSSLPARRRSPSMPLWLLQSFGRSCDASSARSIRCD
jgi:hypothetical protein